MNMNEMRLQSAQYSDDTVVVNNHVLGMVRQWQISFMMRGIRLPCSEMQLIL